ncbi:Ig-like domain-containing protein, partial [Chitinophaga pinensis]
MRHLPAQADGTHAVTATSTDAAGNTSAPSATLNLKVDTQA